MSTAKVPKSICDELDRFIAHFWWAGRKEKNRYCALKSWSEICQPKRCGGLGFRKFHVMINLALLAKLFWMILKGEDKVWLRIMISKYCYNSDASSIGRHGGDSRGWQGMLEARAICQEGVGFMIGSGSLNLWDRPWILGRSLEEIKDSFSYNRTQEFLKLNIYSASAISPGFCGSRTIWKWRNRVVFEGICYSIALIDKDIAARYTEMVTVMSDLHNHEMIFVPLCSSVEVSGVLEGELQAILLALHNANRALCKSFNVVSFTHISRCLNFCADALAIWARCAKAKTVGCLRDVAPFVATKMV
uniref:RNase H type-1 domain-containing protein n=1 Tax=Cannabis sativa TaxID=3483 RepID=A0A803Q5V6_CANSA